VSLGVYARSNDTLTANDTREDTGFHEIPAGPLRAFFHKVPSFILDTPSKEQDADVRFRPVGSMAKWAFKDTQTNQ